MGLMISFNLISKLFPDPIIPALAMVLQPIFTTYFENLLDIQQLPGSIAFIGYLLIVPGLFLILVGQCIFQRSQKKQQVQQKTRLNQLLQMKRIWKIHHSLKKINTTKQIIFQDGLSMNSPHNLSKAVSNNDMQSNEQLGQRRYTIEYHKQKVVNIRQRTVPQSYTAIIRESDLSDESD